ncbi:MAG: zf-TFIIB domain-containing protein [Rhodobacteraceae bacterium]|nr:zf-TFIIB domain-containing protein [Paracoccaceae bacterium]
MKCPIDGTSLLMTERNGVEIDYCPECRGVWLDRGELDKIIERSTAESMHHTEPAHGASAAWVGAPSTRLGELDLRRRRKRDTFLDDLFDF